MRSQPMSERARLALITLFVLTVAAIGLWTLAVGAHAMGANMPAPANPGRPASVPGYAPASSHSPVAPACGPDWVVVSSPNQGTSDNVLSAVTAISSNDVWAVGAYYSSNAVYQTLTEHWDGSSWTIVDSPDASVYLNTLTAVVAVSSSEVWAVGYYSDNVESHPLVEYWDGSTWGVAESPSGVGHDNHLNSVTAISSNDVWAVGFYSTGTLFQTLTEHWNGISWSIINSADASVYNNVLNGVVGISSSDVWAVGYYDPGSGISQTLTEHWDGSAWSVIPSPNVGTGSNFSNAVAAVSSSDVWAVGNYYNGAASMTLTEHWNGSAWIVVFSPNVGTLDNNLFSVSAMSAGDVWAVGNYVDSVQKTLVEQWDGSTWGVVPSPNVGTYNTNLVGVIATAAGDVWAVGNNGTSSSFVRQTLVERYNPCLPPPTNTPTPGAGSTDTPTAGVGSTDTPTATAGAISTGTLTPSPTPMATACSVQYTDVPPDSTFYPYIHCLACLGIVNGYPDGTFKPNNPVTRGQLSKIVSNSAGYNETHTEITFQDVLPGSTFYQFIERLATRGFISGYDCGNPEPCVPPDNLPYFRPNANVTRGQTSKIVASADGLPSPPSGQQSFQDVPEDSTFWQWIEALATTGAINGYACGNPEPCVPPDNLPYFRPNANVTRGQSTKIVGNTFFSNCQAP